MRQEFFEYYRPSDAEFEAFWSDAIIVFDTSVLLNLYSYSSSTAKEILALLSEASERLWIPNWVAFEYHKNRCSVISKEAKKYRPIVESLDEVWKKIEEKKQHPYIDGELAKRFFETLGEMKKALSVRETELRDLIASDWICERLTEIFKDRVGESSTPDELGKIYKEGEERFLKKIPPGYMDMKEKPSPECYGDFVIWRQLMAHAKKETRNVIFVCDDAKEDWWTEVNGKTIGPRYELRREFFNDTGCFFYMYSSDSFIKYAKTHLRNVLFSEKALEEIKETSDNRIQSDQVREYLERQQRMQVVQPSLAKFIRDTPNLAMEEYREHLSQLEAVQQLRDQAAFAASLDPMKGVRDHIAKLKAVQQFRDQAAFAESLDPMKGFRDHIAQHDAVQQLRDQVAFAESLDPMKGLRDHIEQVETVRPFRDLSDLAQEKDLEPPTENSK